MESLAPLKLLGDLTAAQLWPLTNTALPSWLLLVFLPTWKRTPTLVLLSPLLHAVLYAGTLGSVLLFRPAGAASPAVDFTTLAGVIALFDDKNAIFAGWLHYLAFDLLVGRGIILDSLSSPSGFSLLFHIFAVVPCLFLTLMAGPVGFALYIGLRMLRPAGGGKGHVE